MTTESSQNGTRQWGHFNVISDSHSGFCRLIAGLREDIRLALAYSQQPAGQLPSLGSVHKKPRRRQSPDGSYKFFQISKNEGGGTPRMPR